MSKPKERVQLILTQLPCEQRFIPVEANTKHRPLLPLPSTEPANRGFGVFWGFRRCSCVILNACSHCGLSPMCYMVKTPLWSWSCFPDPEPKPLSNGGWSFDHGMTFCAITIIAQTCNQGSPFNPPTPNGQLVVWFGGLGRGYFLMASTGTGVQIQIQTIN